MTALKSLGLKVKIIHMEVFQNMQAVYKYQSNNDKEKFRHTLYFPDYNYVMLQNDIITFDDLKLEFVKKKLYAYIDSSNILCSAGYRFYIAIYPFYIFRNFQINHPWASEVGLYL